MFFPSSRPPSRLYRSAPGPVRPSSSSGHPPAAMPPSFRPPSSLRVYSSFVQNMEISEVQFTCQQSPKDNNSERLQKKAGSGADALLRRGNTLVLRITLSAQIACPYCVSLTFVPVFRSRDRFGQFQAKGEAKGSSELWLSITIPANFPIGKYHAHIAVALRGGAHVITYFHHKPIVVLFNPWNPGTLICTYTTDLSTSIILRLQYGVITNILELIDVIILIMYLLK